MSKLGRAKLALLSDVGLQGLVEDATETLLGTPYGIPPPITLGRVGDVDAALLVREKPTRPARGQACLANFWALNELGVERIIAVDLVAALTGEGPLLIPSNLVNFTKSPVTLQGEVPVDLSNPYCPEVRSALATGLGKEPPDAVYACVDGIYHSTLAEVAVYRKLGCTVVGTASVPEALLARELGMCYATLGVVAAHYTARGREPAANFKEAEERLLPALARAVGVLPKEAGCGCARAPGRAKAEALGLA